MQLMEFKEKSDKYNNYRKVKISSWQKHRK